MIKGIGSKRGNLRVRMNCISHSVINGAGLSGSSDQTLPELATDILLEVSDVVAALKAWCIQLEALQALAPTD